MDISVVIPCFNPKAALIEAAVASILRQSGPAVLRKIIIVDDASTDPKIAATLDRLRLLPAVEIIAHTRRKGPGGARNTGIRRVESEWLAFLDADDLLTDNSFEARTSASERFPDCDWIGGDFALLQTDGTVDGSFFRSRKDPFRYLKAAFDQNLPIRLSKPIEAFIDSALTHTCASLFRTKVLRDVGGFDETLLMQQDYNLFLRLAHRFDFVFVPEIVNLYRQHETNWTKNYASLCSWRAKALERLLSLNDISQYRTQIRKSIASHYLDSAYQSRKDHHFYNALKASAKSLRSAPFDKRIWSCLVASALHR